MLLGIFTAIYLFIPYVRGMLWSGRRDMIELHEGPVDVIIHRNVHVSFFVIIFDIDSNIYGALPVNGVLVV